MPRCTRWVTTRRNACLRASSSSTAAVLSSLPSFTTTSSQAYDSGRNASRASRTNSGRRSEEHTSELQSPCNLVCRLLLEKKKKKIRKGGLTGRNKGQTERRVR